MELGIGGRSAAPAGGGADAGMSGSCVWRFAANYVARGGDTFPNPGACVFCSRLATVFWYLEDVEQGGETFFPRALNSEGNEYKPWNGDHEDCYRGLAVKPVRGNAVLFYSMVPDGRLDERHVAPDHVAICECALHATVHAGHLSSLTHVPRRWPSGRCTAGASREARGPRSGAPTSGSGTIPSAPPTSRPFRSAREPRTKLCSRRAAPTTARTAPTGPRRESAIRTVRTCKNLAGPAARRAEARQRKRCAVAFRAPRRYAARLGGAAQLAPAGMDGALGRTFSEFLTPIPHRHRHVALSRGVRMASLMRWRDAGTACGLPRAGGRFIGWCVLVVVLCYTVFVYT